MPDGLPDPGKIWNDFITNPLVQTAGTLIVVYVVLLWLGTAYWAFRDMQARSENPILPYFASALIIFFTPLLFLFAVVLYLIVRPRSRWPRSTSARWRRSRCWPRSRRTSSAPSAATGSTPTGWSARTAGPGCTVSAPPAADWPIQSGRCAPTADTSSSVRRRRRSSASWSGPLRRAPPSEAPTWVPSLAFAPPLTPDRRPAGGRAPA